MTIEALDYMAAFMEALDIPYDYMEWKGDIPDRYWVGEYQESENDNLEATGYQEASFYLSGFTRVSNLLLEQDKETIKQACRCHTAIMESGSGIAVSYSTGKPVQTGNAELKRIDITLNIQEWRVS